MGWNSQQTVERARSILATFDRATSNKRNPQLHRLRATSAQRSKSRKKPKHSKSFTTSSRVSVRVRIAVKKQILSLKGTFKPYPTENNIRMHQRYNLVSLIQGSVV